VCPHLNQDCEKRKACHITLLAQIKTEQCNASNSTSDLLHHLVGIFQTFHHLFSLHFHSQVFITSVPINISMNIVCICVNAVLNHDSQLGTVENNKNQGNCFFLSNAVFLPKCHVFTVLPCFLPKCHGFTFLQEYLVFNQHKLKFIALLCFHYQSLGP